MTEEDDVFYADPPACGAVLADLHREITCGLPPRHYDRPHRAEEWWHDTPHQTRIAVTTTWGPLWEDDPERVR